MKRELPFITWKYEPQTKMKHSVFEDYFDKWVKILGKYHSLNYLDCFGGCGAYEDKDETIKYGSPILAAQIAKKNAFDLKRNVRIVIIDKDESNIENIRKIFNYLNLDIDPKFVNADFDATVNKILDSADNLAPTFFFIDPFGFTIKIATLRRIMERQRTEILLTFMYNSITRFLKSEYIEDTVNQLFGCNDWKELCDKKGYYRESELIKLYRKKLKEFSKFVFPFKFSFPDKNRTYYYLFHLTNNIKGCSIMKSCFAKYNLGEVGYQGEFEFERQASLFDYTDKEMEDIKRVILSIMDKPKTYLEILEELIDETPYLESEFLKSIKALEEERKIVIKRKPETTKTGRPRKSIAYGDEIVKKGFNHAGD